MNIGVLELGVLIIGLVVLVAMLAGLGLLVGMVVARVRRPDAESR